MDRPTRVTLACDDSGLYGPSRHSGCRGYLYPHGDNLWITCECTCHEGNEAELAAWHEKWLTDEYPHGLHVPGSGKAVSWDEQDRLP